MAAKLFLSGEDSPREWFGFGLLCRLCGLSFSLRCGATRWTSPPSPAGAGGGFVCLFCARWVWFHLSPSQAGPWPLSWGRQVGLASMAHPEEPCAGGWGGRTFLSTWDGKGSCCRRFTAGSPLCHTLLGPCLHTPCYVVELASEGTCRFCLWVFLWFSFHLIYIIVIIFTTSCNASLTVRSPLTKRLVFVFPGHSERAGEMWPKLCTAKGLRSQGCGCDLTRTLETEHWLINHLWKCWDPVILLERFFTLVKTIFKRYLLPFSISGPNVRIYNSENNGKPALVWRMISAFLIKIYNPVILALWDSVETVLNQRTKGCAFLLNLSQLMILSSVHNNK